VDTTDLNSSKMRPEETYHIEQLKKLGHILKENIGIKTTRDGMYGGVATWQRDQNRFEIHKCGTSSEGNLKHIEIQCLDKIDELVAREVLNYENLIYMYLNKAPCADYNGNRKNCLDKVLKWAKNNPTKKLILGFRKPYAIGAFTERGSLHKPDKEVWPLYRMNLMCRDIPTNLTIVSLYRGDRQTGFGTELFHAKQQDMTSTITSLERNLKTNPMNTDKIAHMKKQEEDLKNMLKKIEREIKITRQSNDKIQQKLENEKLRKVENKTKEKFLKNKTSDIKEFDKEKRLIDTFIMAQKKQRAESISSHSSFRGAINTDKQLKSWNRGQTIQMVPIDVN